MQHEMDVLYRRLVELGLERHAAPLVALAAPSIRLHALPVGKEDVPVGGTKVGGRPDLPAGFAWPRFNQLPQSFIAQIDLEQVAGHDLRRKLPPAGLLSFFYDSEQSIWGFDPADRGGWQVVFTPPGTSLGRMDLAPGLPDLAMFACRALQPQVELTLASWESFVVNRLDLNREELFTYAGAVVSESTVAHRLLGHPDPIQGDMQLECQLATNGIYVGDTTGYDDPRARVLESGAADWELLLQIDSDHDSGMLWGDAGRLYYWIRGEDLAAHRFDQVWLIMQCY